MLSVSNVKKYYGHFEALGGVDFSVASGEIVGLLGHNGAGKTTTLKILTGYLEADTGAVSVDGLDIVKERQRAQARIGYLAENAPMYPELLVQDYLGMMAEARGIYGAKALEAIAKAVKATDLGDKLTSAIATLSKGYRQRVGLAQAILHEPSLLVLDEPTVGLDPQQLRDIRALIQRLAASTTIIFSTHILSEVEALCDRAIIMARGRVRADARLADLARGSSLHLALADVADKSDAVCQALRSIAELSSVEALPPTEGGLSRFRVSADDASDVAALVYPVVYERGWQLREMVQEQRSLESVVNDIALAEAEDTAEDLAEGEPS